MKQLAVISGKGGTGKTSLVAAFAQLASPVVLADCDVDASNLPLILKPTADVKSEPYVGGYFVELDRERCNQSKECALVCRFDAIEFDAEGQESKFPLFDFYACEGCGACVDVCPEKAISLIDRVAGTLYETRMRFGPMVYAELGIAEGTSGKLVSQVRDRARKIAKNAGLDLILIDGSPGIGCPVIASVTGVDAVLIVTEPTVSGHHDLERVGELANHFRIPAAMIVNKWDLNPEMTEKIEYAARGIGIEALGRVGFDRAFVDSIVNGRTVLEEGNDAIAHNLEAIFSEIKKFAGT